MHLVTRKRSVNAPYNKVECKTVSYGIEIVQNMALPSLNNHSHSKGLPFISMPPTNYNLILLCLGRGFNGNAYQDLACKLNFAKVKSMTKLNLMSSGFILKTDEMT